MCRRPLAPDGDDGCIRAWLPNFAPSLRSAAVRSGIALRVWEVDNWRMRIFHLINGIAAVAAFFGTQKPTLAQGGFTGPGWYQITNLKSGKSLALAPDMRAVVQLNPQNAENQAWMIEPVQGGLFAIRSGVTGNALQPTSGERNAPVVTAVFDGQPGQQWRIQPGKDGTALI